ncbi:NUDIX domain-containing protein [Aeromonas sp. 19NY04SH05-1]|uniref:NUDIX domain-containing protein n=2 Tax=Aeromonas TaxID=642 RepID=A0AAU6TB18_9GAMM|nr:NUDIX domain-containing protein [Aeromonas enteropelogenes]MBL0520461.1 NUDIX domain-containing protein [Aeromonas enteropelogenes]UBH50647.1 NUDIX domain-containing protein [Aeromonas enteropelogenes]
MMTLQTQTSCWPDPFAIDFVHGQVPTDGSTLERLTVRAVVARDDELLLVHSRVNGDFMFPGGGVEAGESHAAALARELREECGAELLEVGALLGETREYRPAREQGVDAYCIRSLYYLCRIGETLVAPQPQPYEIRLGFVPGWIAIEEALQTNKTQLAGPCPQWTVRETRVLAQLQRWWQRGVFDEW